jgi:hypothetical protein
MRGDKRQIGSGEVIAQVTHSKVTRTDVPLSKFPFRFPVWLSTEEALTILDIIDGEDRLKSLLPKIKSAAAAQKAGNNPVSKRLADRQHIIDNGDSEANWHG